MSVGEPSGKWPKDARQNPGPAPFLRPIEFELHPPSCNREKLRLSLWLRLREIGLELTTHFRRRRSDTFRIAMASTRISD